MSCCCHNNKPETPPKGKNNSTLWLKLALSILLGGLSMYLSLGVNISAPQGLTRTVLHSTLALVSAGAIFGLGRSMLISAWKSTRDRKVTLEHAFLIGVIGSFAASLYSSFSGMGAIYYEVVVVLIAIYVFGQVITAQQIKQHSELTKLIPGLHGSAVLQDGTKVSIDSLTVGQEVQLLPGEYVPVDGSVVSGSAYIEQQAHTGETYPQVKSKSEKILAGSRVLDGYITLKSTSSGKTREIDRLLEALTSSADINSPIQLLTQKILNLFVPIVLAIALLTGLVWTLLGEPAQGWLNALTVTVVACPCALGVAIPLALRKGLAELQILGIIPKQSEFIDRLANVNAVAFDKTGTLSKGRLELDELKISPEAPKNLTDIIIAIQKKSTHPVARPFWSLKETNTIPPSTITVEQISGRGLKALIGDEEIFIGNSLLATEKGIGVTSDSRSLFVIYRDKLVATAWLKEEVRKSSSSTLNKLADNNIKVSILTGDTSIPKDYNIPKLVIHSGLSSAQKAHILSQDETPTLYIGDGLNDCEGFQQAHTSLALKSGNPAATEIAQAVLLHDNLSIIPEAIKMVRLLQGRLKKILLLSFLYNLSGITLAVLGLLHPIVAAILMFSSSITVIAALNKTNRSKLTHE